MATATKTTTNGHTTGAVALLPTAQPLAQRLGLTPEKLELIRGQLAPQAPDDVLELYFERCRLTGADPFARMFYAQKRRCRDGDNYVDRWTIETTIDGFRSIAESTTEYDGQDEPLFVYDKNGALIAAKVTVYRKDMTRPITGVAFYKEYVQCDRNGTVVQMWQKMPHNQLAKCAEALALRKAFPRRFSGLYTNDEMPPPDQSDSPPHAYAAPASAAAEIRSEVQAQPVLELAAMDRTSLIAEVFSLNGFGKMLTGKQMQDVLADIAGVMHGEGFARIADIDDATLRAYLARKRDATEASPPGDEAAAVTAASEVPDPTTVTAASDAPDERNIDDLERGEASDTQLRSEIANLLRQKGKTEADADRFIQERIRPDATLRTADVATLGLVIKKLNTLRDYEIAFEDIGGAEMRDDSLHSLPPAA